MKILMFSMTPLFENYAMGGAQIQLKKVALHLAQTEHDVTILCTRRDAEHQGFFWHPNAEIIPMLRFKQPYPEPYATPVYNIANAIQDVSEYLLNADVYYSHDGGLIFPYVYQHIPTVISLRSILFAETLQSAFLFDGDSLILPSNYMKDCLIATAGRFFPELDDKTRVINNGFNWEIFRAQSPDKIADYIPSLDTSSYQYILFPHRPELNKGFMQCIDVVKRLVDDYRMRDIRVLVPEWIKDAQSEGDREFYRLITDKLEELDLSDYFVFHGWIPGDLLPEYYSIGSLTFVIGSYVETFGNVAFESLGCGTPVIISKVGPGRTLIPDEHIHRVEFGDIETTAQIAYKVLSENEAVPRATLDYLKAQFPLDKMVEAFADEILNAKKTSRLHYEFVPLEETAYFSLSPWSYVSSRGIYNDFTAEYFDNAGLIHLFEDKRTISRASLQASGLSDEAIQGLVRDGYLSPALEDNIAYISMGSNQDAPDNLRRALSEISALTRLVSVSPVYESEAVGDADNPNYFNMAVKIKTRYSATSLKYQILRNIERRLGRDRNKLGVVSIDLDLVLFNEDVLSKPDLIIPDEDIGRYLYVALPLADIEPDYTHPVSGETLSQISDKLKSSQKLIRRDDISPMI